MAVAVNKRLPMVLYSDPQDVNSHRVRIVLAEKGVTVDVIEVHPHNLPEDLTRLNPYGSLPTLIDRDLVLYEPDIIVEYLDERFPHPPLLPVYPVARAKSRLMMHRIEREWYDLVKKIRFGSDAEAKSSRKLLLESLIAFMPVFDAMPFFMGDEFSLLDACVAPLLWRLPKLGINLPPQAKGIKQYADRMFERRSFKASLAQSENEHEEA